MSLKYDLYNLSSFFPSWCSMRKGLLTPTTFYSKVEPLWLLHFYCYPLQDCPYVGDAEMWKCGQDNNTIH